MSDENTNAATEPSPLAEAKSDSLDELFARIDKHIAERTLSSSLAKADAEKVCVVLREQRERWLIAKEAGAKRGPSMKKQSDTTLADLGLD